MVKEKLESYSRAQKTGSWKHSPITGQRIVFSDVKWGFKRSGLLDSVGELDRAKATLATAMDTVTMYVAVGFV